MNVPYPFGAGGVGSDTAPSRTFAVEETLPVAVPAVNSPVDQS